MGWNSWLGVRHSFDRLHSWQDSIVCLLGDATIYHGIYLHDDHPWTRNQLQSKKEPMKELDPLLHSQLRLAVMSILMNVDEADFNYLKEKTDATAGNLSVQLDKLSTAAYISVEKGFVGKKTRTVCQITEQGRKAFEEYVEAIKEYLNL